MVLIGPSCAAITVMLPDALDLHEFIAVDAMLNSDSLALNRDESERVLSEMNRIMSAMIVPGLSYLGSERLFGW